QLALIQTNFVIDSLKKKFPQAEFEIIAMTTTGDQILDIALSKIGEKSLFTRELEERLLDKSIDFVVHSLKDLPTQLPEGLVIGSVLKRDDDRDAVVIRKDLKFKSLADLPDNSVVGTSSLRRAAQIKRKYPKLIIKDIRGNLNTRFRKLDEATDFDCIILAAAGLDRMKWSDRISQYLEPSDCLYAVAQGAMAVECCSNDSDLLTLLNSLHDNPTMLRCIAERAFLRTLEGGCSVPVAVHTEYSPDKMTLTGGVFSIGGKEAIIDSLSTDLSGDEPAAKKSKASAYASIMAESMSQEDMKSAEKLGEDLANEMLKNGADAILKATKAQMAAEIIKDKAEREAKKSQS
ncbi:hypothetical protein CAPTEDRAFT_142723, partial [Capitella teleta]